MAEDEFDGEGKKDVKIWSMDAFGESWQDSQFWVSWKAGHVFLFVYLV